ncbi:MAG TPA: NAD(P)-dependent oxidoreductase [Burkholderiaceae bacterium]|jgi:nucleoside-diphosphate-sugar epimerase|nr:NAD(P)-dependent oxidoreductase [Burkholderiaceae bacterium]
MKVLVTGANGFIGRHVLRCLARHYIEAVALGRSCPAGVAREAFIEADLLDCTDLPERLSDSGVTHLLHLAWVTEHGAFWASPQNFDWVQASVALVRAFALSGGRHVVVAGTCAEYDWSHGLCREHTTPIAPVSTYGVAKDATRRLLSSLCESSGLSLAWGRVFLTHGQGEDARRLVPGLIDALTGARPAFAVNRHAWRDFLPAGDVAEGLVALLRYGARGDYNISSGQPLQIGELVRELAVQLGADPDRVLSLPAPPRRGEPALLVGESQRLQALGWQPRHSLRSALAETIASRALAGHSTSAARSIPSHAEETP